MSEERSAKRQCVEPDPGDDLVRDLGVLLANGILHDVSFCFEDGTIVEAHRVILSARSAYFRNMFGSGLRECSQEQIQMTGCSKDAFMLVLRYLYTGILEIDVHQLAVLVDAYRLADKYVLKRLTLLLEEKVLDGLVLEQAAGVLRAAQGLDALSDKLKEKVPQLARNHLELEQLLSLYLETEDKGELQLVQEQLSTEVLCRVVPTTAASLLRSVISAGCSSDFSTRVQGRIMEIDLHLLVQHEGSMEILEAAAPALVTSICKALSCALVPPVKKWGEMSGHWRQGNNGLIAHFESSESNIDNRWKVIQRDGVLQQCDVFSVRVLCLKAGCTSQIGIATSSGRGAFTMYYCPNGNIRWTDSELPASVDREYGEGSILTIRVKDSTVTVLKDGTQVATAPLPEGGPYCFTAWAKNSKANRVSIELVNCHAQA